jgi:hypothetical protein
LLAVGDPEEWRKQGNVLPVTRMAFVAFHDMSQEMLDTLRPSIIFSPLLARSFDCIELAMLLQKLGYSGEYRAVASDIPNPDLIEREVRQLCPQINFRIVRMT